MSPSLPPTLPQQQQAPSPVVSSIQQQQQQQQSSTWDATSTQKQINAETRTLVSALHLSDYEPKQQAAKQAALIAALISLQQQQLGLLVNLVQLDNTLWQMAVPRVNHAAPVHLVPVVKNAPVVFFDRRKTRI